MIEISGAGGKPVTRNMQDSGAFTLLVLVRDIEFTVTGNDFTVLNKELGHISVDTTLNVFGTLNAPKIAGLVLVHSARLEVDQIVERFSGEDFDGIALCGFGSEDDLRLRFFDGPEGQQAIRDDVASFADTARSPRRVLCQEWTFR